MVVQGCFPFRETGWTMPTRNVIDGVCGLDGVLRNGTQHVPSRGLLLVSHDSVVTGPVGEEPQFYSGGRLFVAFHQREETDVAEQSIIGPKFLRTIVRGQEGSR